MTENGPGFLEWLDTGAGRVPRISTKLTFADHLGACKARWGIGRMKYIVPPGLYAIGHPSHDDPVVVTANYKMSFDIVRKAVAGRNVWLLVLETFGINVWCAAGKGTFGTGELVRRIEATGLARVVSHRRLLLPILGAPGVSAHEVARRSGFTIRYATIMAADLPEFLDNGLVTTAEMQQMTFTFLERLVLIPVELVEAFKSVAAISLLLFLAFLLSGGVVAAVTALIVFLGAVLTGVVATPLLLPWLPGRSFALKGAVAGMVWSAAFLAMTGTAVSIPAVIAAILILPAVSAFYTLNFTGCTPYTSRSGVKKEMRLGLPVMGGAVVLGLLVLLAGRIL
jgi:hypothetical protein